MFNYCTLKSTLLFLIEEINNNSNYDEFFSFLEHLLFKIAHSNFYPSGNGITSKILILFEIWIINFLQRDIIHNSFWQKSQVSTCSEQKIENEMI